MTTSTQLDSTCPDDLLALKAILCSIAQYISIYDRKLKTPELTFRVSDSKRAAYRIHKIDDLENVGVSCILCDSATALAGYDSDVIVCKACPNKGWAELANQGDSVACLEDSGYKKWYGKENPLGMLDALTKSLLRYDKEIAALTKVGTVIHIKSINTTIYLDDLGIKEETLDLLISNYEKV